MGNDATVVTVHLAVDARGRGVLGEAVERAVVGGHALHATLQATACPHLEKVAASDQLTSCQQAGIVFSSGSHI